MTEWKPNPVIVNALSSGPRMFASIALPLIEKFGDEAKKMISEIMYKDGFEKGKRLAKTAKDVNDLVEFERILVEDYNKQGFNTPGFDDPARTWLVQSKHHCRYNLGKGPCCEENIPKVWEDMGYDADTIRLLGELHCEPYDKGVREGYNPKIKLIFAKLATRGDPYCEWDEVVEE